MVVTINCRILRHINEWYLIVGRDCMLHAATCKRTCSWFVFLVKIYLNLFFSLWTHQEQYILVLLESYLFNLYRLYYEGRGAPRRSRLMGMFLNLNMWQSHPYYFSRVHKINHMRIKQTNKKEDKTHRIFVAPIFYT